MPPFGPQHGGNVSGTALERLRIVFWEMEQYARRANKAD
jgi:hypothetical protein